MRTATAPLLLIAASLSSALVLPPEPQHGQHPFLSPQAISHDDDDASAVPADRWRVPTVHESAIMARRMLRYETLGTLSTVFPEPSHENSSLSTSEIRPDDVAGSPIALMEYFADCEPDTGNPTLLAIHIATPYRNYEAGSNITLSLRWHPESSPLHYPPPPPPPPPHHPPPPAPHHGGPEHSPPLPPPPPPHHHLPPNPNTTCSSPDVLPIPITPAALPRYALVGKLESFSAEDAEAADLASCFTRAHPDSHLWLPGNDIHTSSWQRFVVEEVYWFGGFGDRALIGWIPIEEWRGITEEEIEGCRLPGEWGRGAPNMRPEIVSGWKWPEERQK
ncbi:pyridoxamine 5'-phosphate oxidase-domain-containing protein [Lineolata rhizophorae]|uniref:Pyridoxamine 5'-phosphate oxidase-domain-containing protein n=1 Tax=Lineolata rhizophorae TaxID=578093 RepID=A0A6A6P3N8_9PEZI|nr:pyridoxamine 5'-phosphate oxidase-domain-containing protein [Lineolata rhizophorae]